MPLIYITDPTGAGKSTIRAYLREKGYKAHDTDEDGISLHYNRQTGQAVEYPKDKKDRTPEWHAEHVFNMSPERIEQLAKQAENKTIFLCGVAANDLELAHYFSKIVCLVIDIETMKQRVATRTTNNFGKAPDELKTILNYYQPVIDKYTKAGAVMIDATKSLDEVVDEIIKLTNPDTLTFANADLAQEITKDAYPDAKQITLIEHGYDNIVVLVDDLYALRFPRNQDAYARSQYEKQVLQHLETLDTVSVPKVLGEHANPPYLLTSFVAGKHLSPKDINNFSIALQQELGESIATFAYSMHTAFSVGEARRLRKELRLDERPEEPWPAYFERLLSGDNLLTPEQDVVAKEYYEKWKKIDTSNSPLVVVHDDLHTENMLFKDNRLCGVLDFGDTNIGTSEQDLRQLYRINETILNAAANKYSELSGHRLNMEAIELWAVMQELASYAERLLTENTSHPAFARASGNLNMWLTTDIWGKGLVSLNDRSSYQ